MDTFFEQIISIKKSPAQIMIVALIWIVALLITFGAVMFLGSFSILAGFGLFYAAIKLSGKFNIEYEYIVTNTSLDIDKITNKSSRVRVLSLELPTVSRLEKFNPHAIANINSKELVIACNLKSDDAYLLVCDDEKGKSKYLVFAPNNKVRSGMLKFIPKFIANSAFK